jgi:hypothetical protein
MIYLLLVIIKSILTNKNSTSTYKYNMDSLFLVTGTYPSKSLITSVPLEINLLEWRI